MSDAAVTQTSVHSWYPTLAKPPGTPPNWLFGPVWTVLYVMIGVAGWRVWQRIGSGPALRLWGWQLLANAAWTPAFFGLRSPGLALPVILLMLALTLRTVRAFRLLDQPAAWLLVPYAAWGAYACYLNAGITLLNRN